MSRGVVDTAPGPLHLFCNSPCSSSPPASNCLRGLSTAAPPIFSLNACSHRRTCVLDLLSGSTFSLISPLHVSQNTNEDYPVSSTRLNVTLFSPLAPVIIIHPATALAFIGIKPRQGLGISSSTQGYLCSLATVHTA